MTWGGALDEELQRAATALTLSQIVQRYHVVGFNLVDATRATRLLRCATPETILSLVCCVFQTSPMSDQVRASRKPYQMFITVLADIFAFPVILTMYSNCRHVLAQVHSPTALEDGLQASALFHSLKASKSYFELDLVLYT